MRFTRIALYWVAMAFAASVCCTNNTPPTPHISGPDSGFVNVPVEFIAAYEAYAPTTSWYADGASIESPGLIAHLTYTDTGIHVVWAKGFWGVTNWFDYTTYYESKPSNLCTLRILPAPARAAKP